MKSAKQMGGYLCVHLYKNGNIKRYGIHRLVLESFVGPCPEGMECCHNDGNPSNNFVENLRWDTRSNNQKDRESHGTMTNPIWIDRKGSKNGRAKLKEEDIPNIRNLIKYGLSNIEISKIFNVSKYTIKAIRLNKNWKHIL